MGRGQRDSRGLVHSLGGMSLQLEPRLWKAEPSFFMREVFRKHQSGESKDPQPPEARPQQRDRVEP